MATLVIENAPDDVVARLHKRAARRRTTVGGEALDILAATVLADDDVPVMTLEQIMLAARADGLSSGDESVAMIREDRDRADGRH